MRADQAEVLAFHGSDAVMETTLVSSNVVVIATAFNPSVVRESFLHAIGVVTPKSILAGFVFSEQVVNVPTKRFNILVVPQQLQVVPVERADAHEVVRTVVPAIVKALPHTPYVAAGINFVWHLSPTDETLEQATRRLFGAQAGPLADVFAAEDACFGFFASKDLAGVRLKADIKPIHVKAPGMPRREGIQCAFNFHVDLTEADAAAEVSALCARWRELDALAEELSGRLARGGAA